MSDKRPVIVYGGSFDPPHRGHTALAAAALRRLKPAALYFVPGFRTPFKEAMPVSYESRAVMLKAALREAGLGDRREIKISPFEARRRRVVYTWETVEHFRRRHPGAAIYFLMGSDCLAGFGRWKDPERVLKSATLLVGRRPGSLRLPPAARYELLPGVFPEADSTDLRAALYAGRRPRQLHRAVAEAAESRSCYLGRERRALAGLIKPSRYAHTIHTLELALELCGPAGVPQRQAALAALLHDCARDLPAARQLKLCPPSSPRLKETAEKAPVLLHAWAGAELARRKFGVRDPGVLAAIRDHATGAPGMGPLARLLYVSDLANRGRTFREAALVRRLARLDLDAAFSAANYVKLVYTFSCGGWVHPLSAALWNSLQEKKRG